VHRKGELSHMSRCSSDAAVYKPTLKILPHLRSLGSSVVRCVGGSTTMEFRYVLLRVRIRKPADRIRRTADRSRKTADRSRRIADRSRKPADRSRRTVDRSWKTANVFGRLRTVSGGLPTVVGSRRMYPEDCGPYTIPGGRIRRIADRIRKPADVSGNP
jgi:hypothetical protein